MKFKNLLIALLIFPGATLHAQGLDSESTITFDEESQNIVTRYHETLAKIAAVQASLPNFRSDQMFRDGRSIEGLEANMTRYTYAGIAGAIASMGSFIVSLGSDIGYGNYQTDANASDAVKRYTKEMEEAKADLTKKSDALKKFSNKLGAGQDAHLKVISGTELDRLNRLNSELRDATRKFQDKVELVDYHAGNGAKIRKRWAITGLLTALTAGAFYKASMTEEEINRIHANLNQLEYDLTHAAREVESAIARRDQVRANALESRPELESYFEKAGDGKWLPDPEGYHNIAYDSFCTRNPTDYRCPRQEEEPEAGR